MSRLQCNGQCTVNVICALLVRASHFQSVALTVTFPVHCSPGQARPGQARPGQARPGQARPGQARPGQARPGQARPGQARPGQARPGQARPGQARPGQARPGQARPGQARPGVFTQSNFRSRPRVVINMHTNIGYCINSRTNKHKVISTIS